MELDGETGGSIQRTKRVIHERTSISSTRPRQKNEGEDGCIRLCDRQSFVNGV